VGRPAGFASWADAPSDNARPADESSVPLTNVRREMELQWVADEVVEFMEFIDE